MEETQKKDIGAGQLTPGAKAKFLEAFAVVQEYLYRINESKGWHDPAATDAECVANVHGEVSELNDWLRQGFSIPSDHIPLYTGVEEEGADVVIRLSNWFSRRGWRLADAILAKAEYNASRPHRHGDKVY